MQVFVSWSGAASHAAAKALKDVLPSIIQSLDVFLSSEDIEKGEPWFQKLGETLEGSDFAILCLTPENLDAPWLLYEAGAAGKHFEQARVVPLLIGLTSADLISPLSHLNAAKTDREDMFKLVTAINNHAKDDKLSKEALANSFKKWWKDLDSGLKKATAQATQPVAFEYDVFLSAPMAALNDNAAYQKSRAETLKVFNALHADCGFKVYWAMENIESIDQFDSRDAAVLEDLTALDKSATFVLLYPEKLATSALFEAGYALALGRRSHFFVRETKQLPYLMQKLEGPAAPLVSIHDSGDWTTYDDIAAKIRLHKDLWFVGTARDTKRAGPKGRH